MVAKEYVAVPKVEAVEKDALPLTEHTAAAKVEAAVAELPAHIVPKLPVSSKPSLADSVPDKRIMTLLALAF